MVSTFVQQKLNGCWANEMLDEPSDQTVSRPFQNSSSTQNRIQDSNVSSQMYLWRRTTVSFRLDKNQ